MAENVSELQQFVEVYLNDGYTLYGNLIVDRAWYLQVVVKLV